MKGKIRKNKQAKVGFDGKPVKTLAKMRVTRPRQTFGGGQPRDYLGGGSFTYRKIEGCP